MINPRDEARDFSAAGAVAHALPSVSLRGVTCRVTHQLTDGAKSADACDIGGARDTHRSAVRSRSGCSVHDNILTCRQQVRFCSQQSAYVVS